MYVIAIPTYLLEVVGGRNQSQFTMTYKNSLKQPSSYSEIFLVVIGYSASLCTVLELKF